MCHSDKAGMLKCWIMDNYFYFFVSLVLCKGEPGLPPLASWTHSLPCPQLQRRIGWVWPTGRPSEKAAGGRRERYSPSLQGSPRIVCPSRKVTAPLGQPFPQNFLLVLVDLPPLLLSLVVSSLHSSIPLRILFLLNPFRIVINGVCLLFPAELLTKIVLIMPFKNFIFNFYYLLIFKIMPFYFLYFWCFDSGEAAPSRARQNLKTVNNSPASVPYICSEAILNPHLQRLLSGALSLRATIPLPYSPLGQVSDN